jgi:hypothetical protein
MAARELGGRSLSDALDLSLLIREADRWRFERASVRWLRAFHRRAQPDRANWGWPVLPWPRSPGSETRASTTSFAKDAACLPDERTSAGFASPGRGYGSGARRFGADGPSRDARRGREGGLRVDLAPTVTVSRSSRQGYWDSRLGLGGIAGVSHVRICELRIHRLDLRRERGPVRLTGTSDFPLICERLLSRRRTSRGAYEAFATFSISRRVRSTIFSRSVTSSRSIALSAA